MIKWSTIWWLSSIHRLNSYKDKAWGKGIHVGNHNTLIAIRLQLVCEWSHLNERSLSSPHLYCCLLTFWSWSVFMLAWFSWTLFLNTINVYIFTQCLAFTWCFWWATAHFLLSFDSEHTPLVSPPGSKSSSFADIMYIFNQRKVSKTPSNCMKYSGNFWGLSTLCFCIWIPFTHG